MKAKCPIFVGNWWLLRGEVAPGKFWMQVRWHRLSARFGACKIILVQRTFHGGEGVLQTGLKQVEWGSGIFTISAGAGICASTVSLLKFSPISKEITKYYGVINSKLIVSYTFFWNCPSPNTSLEDPNRPNGLRGLVPNKHGTSLQRQSRLVWVWRSKGDFLMW